MGEPKEKPSAKESKSSSPKTGPRDRGGAGAKKTDSGAAKSSRDYKAKDLKATGKEDWKKERSKHTAAAEKAARKDVKAATGKDAKIAGQKPGAKVEHHHHAGVKESKQVGLNPKVAGEKERMTAVHSSKSEKVHGTIGDKAEPAKNKKLTHHNVASKIDKAEQSRTARALGAKGDSPKLPKTDAGRKGMVDASGTSKWRWPATADQAERAKQTWSEKTPRGPKVDAKGVVKPSEPPSTKLKGPPDAVRNVTKEGGGFWGKLGRLEKAGKVLGPVGNVLGASGDVIRIWGRDHPEKLPEGAKVELYKPREDLPIIQDPTGYTVEKQSGSVIYRRPNGEECSKDEAMQAAGERPTKA